MRTVLLMSAAAVSTLLFVLPVVDYALPVIDARAAAPVPAAEKHLRNIRQLTHGGENAEAYFSLDGKKLIFQATRAGYPCDRIYTINIDGTQEELVSTGTGRTTCGYFYPGAKEILFASTHGAGPACPPKPSYERGYVWPVYAGYDIYKAAANGTGLTNLTRSPGYDAEATIAPDGAVAFTSLRDGDMEIYSMNGDGTGVRRLTNRQGPDGGPFFSWDGRRIVFRGRPLDAGGELNEYRALLKEALWRPTQLELYVMDRDGSNLAQVTNLAGANFAPAWHPDGRRLIFASNVGDPRGRNFDVYLVNVDGSALERVTFNDTFDGFPMFSPDGRHLVFASNRNARSEGETNVFIADWVN